MPISLQPDTHSLPPVCPCAIKILGSFFILKGFLTLLSWPGPSLSTIPSNIPLLFQSEKAITITSCKLFWSFFHALFFLKLQNSCHFSPRRWLYFDATLIPLSYTLIKTTGNLPRGKATCLQLRKQFCTLFPGKFRNFACRRSTMMKEGHNSLLNVLCIIYSTYKINYVLQLDRHKMV